ncbi:amidohydrolase family protein [Saccharopolyspora sp. K220]|uniref:amidohydrolase family protein n=1 Tax=Saccharopolyspora soli TaxID=2926618 RepID=UPI001F56DCDA|nr:amidohydrolase family protein [Saccharopolyspora soli]MCI2420451.1 amidohydrolase family protein [Saccharopolyspora soli]
MHTSVDTHAHVFHRGLPLAANRRYAPDYDARLADYLAELDRHDIGRAVLVQPSFLGTDNTFLLDCAARRPERLRAVVVVDPAELDLAGLDRLHAVGVRGIRLNLIGAQVPDLAAWEPFADRMAKLGVHLEFQARGPQWVQLAPALRDWPGPVVIDHVGLPRCATDPGRRAVRELAAHEHVWVKVSAPYRSPSGQASAAAAELADTVGADRLLWGSDWPWTQHERDRSFGELLSWAQALLGARFARVLRENPARLLDWS